MREDVVWRDEMYDLRMEREADVFVSEREMREETEMDKVLPDSFMSVRLSVPSVLSEKTEAELKDASMEMQNALRERDTPSTLKKDALPDVMTSVASLVVVIGVSEAEADFVV